MADRGELEAKLAVIKRDYVAELPARATSLRSAWILTQSEDWAQPPLRELHRLDAQSGGFGRDLRFRGFECARARPGTSTQGSAGRSFRGSQRLTGTVRGTDDGAGRGG